MLSHSPLRDRRLNTKHQKILSSVGFMQEMFRMQMLDSKSRDCSWDHVGKEKQVITTTNPKSPILGGFKN